GETSEYAQLEVMAHNFAKLLHHLERVAQQLALHAGEMGRSDQRARRSRRCGKLPVEPQHQQEAERLAEIAGKLGLQHPEIAQAADALVGGCLEQAMLDGEAANAVHDREYAAFLEVERISRALRRDQLAKQANRRLEGVDGACEVRQKG